jgi:arylamine N-acetyltransferase
LPLEENTETPGIGPGSFRLIKDNISVNTDPGQRLWIFQSRETPDGPWLTNYCFTELEFLPGDFEVMSFKTSMSKTSWFTNKVVCVKMLLDDDKEKIIGTITMMENSLTRKVDGKKETLATLENEKQRVEALEKWFDIRLRPEEIDGIKGMVSSLG